MKQNPRYDEIDRYEAEFCALIENHFRLYNLINSNDPNEYLYAAELLQAIYKIQGFEDDWIKKYIRIKKENSFITSCTTKDSLNTIDFWEEYADHKRGVAIELEILNKPEIWEFFYLSKIHYNQLASFNQLISEWATLQLKNPNIRYFSPHISVQ